MFQQGDTFICGLCRSKHKNRADAWECLQHCWLEIQEINPLVKRRVIGKGTVYRCRFCSRDYTDQNEAMACAADCKVKRKEQYEKQMAAVRVVDNIQPKKINSNVDPEAINRKIRLEKISKMRYNLKRRSKDEEIIPSPTEEILEQAPKAKEAPPPPKAEPQVEEPVPEVTEPTPEQEAESKKLVRKSDFDSQWFRKDAKYCCRFCSSEFFTKVEVEACFNGHFDENGIEIPQE